MLLVLVLRQLVLIVLVLLVFMINHHILIAYGDGRHRDSIRTLLLAEMLLLLTLEARLALFSGTTASAAAAPIVGESPDWRGIDIALGINPLCPYENFAIPEAFLPRDHTFVTCWPRAVTAQASPTTVVTRFAVVWRHAPNAVGAAELYWGSRNG